MTTRAPRTGRSAGLGRIIFALLLGAGQAAEAAPGTYVASEVSYFLPDTSAFDDSDISLGIGFGLVTADRTRLELTYYALRLIPDELPGLVDQKNLLFNAYFDFDARERFSSYASAGIGVSRVEFRGVSVQPFASLGVGLSWRVIPSAPAWLDGEIRGRYLYDRDEALGDAELLDGQALLRVRYGFGGQGGATDAAPHATPPDGSAPAAPRGPAPGAEKDADADGVPDERDHCPNTIPDVVVDTEGCMVRHD